MKNYILKSEKFRKLFHVNKPLIPLKIVIFLWFSAVNILYPYLTIHIKEIGISAKVAGVLYLIITITGFFGPPIIGMIVDKFGHFKLILSISLILIGISHLAILFVPSSHTILPISTNLNATCTNNRGLLFQNDFSNPWQECKLERLPKSFKCSSICNSSTIDISFNSSFCYNGESSYHCFGNISEKIYYVDENTKIENFTKSLMSAHTIQCFSLENTNINSTSDICINPQSQCFALCDESLSEHLKNISDWTYTSGNIVLTYALYFTIRIIGNIIFSAYFSLLDASTHCMVKMYGSSFGRERIFSLLGMIISTPVGGALVDYMSQGKEKADYSACFYIFFGISVLLGFLVLKMEIPFETANDNILQNLRKIIKIIEIDVYIWTAFVTGAYFGFGENYLFWFLEELKSPKLISGLTQSVGHLSALPVLFFSKKILNYFGQIPILIVSFAAFGVKFIGYYFLHNPYYSLLIETTESVTYHLSWVAASVYAHAAAPKGLTASLQGIMCAVHFGIGRGFGSFVGGLLIDAVNIRNTFLIMAISSFSFTLIYIIGYVVILTFFPNKRPFEPSNLSENHTSPDLEKSVSSKQDTKLSIQDNHVKL